MKMKRALLLTLALGVAGCGGGVPRDRAPVVIQRAAPIASGPISTACLQSGREGRSRQLCGCVQAAANQTLTRAQQRRSVAFYSNPHLAQEIRQSDRAVDEAFWDAYADYAERAERLCG